MDQDGGRHKPPLQARERCGDGAVAPDIPPIEVGETKEMLEALPVGGLGPLLNRSHLLGIHGDAAGGDYVAEKCGRCARELTLLGLHEQPVLQETLEDLEDVTLVRSSVLGENEDAIEI